ncbi:MAG: isoprenylcysteine carboxylmethyltransferase family protein [Elusimicrobia bacterium]|nr:isoprenylcysteine carboxylmethyltransferase family protein [Elusimicrobiota bacterium]
MSAAATEFEFKNRFWIIGALFWLSFSLYAIDPVPMAGAVGAWVLPLGAALTFAAAGLRTWAAAYLDSEVVHDRALHSDALVADGPYRHLRNPLYLGTILIAAGLGMAASRSGFWVLTAGMIVITVRLMGREEAHIAAAQGAGYREFCRLVPRIVPSLRPRVPAGGLKARWGQAFAGEIFSWSFFVGMLAFCATERPNDLWIPIAAGLLIQGLWGLAKKKTT